MPQRHHAGNAIPDWASWLAQDADGTWWAYEHEPNQSHNGWYENEVGRQQSLHQEADNPDWQTTLTAIDNAAGISSRQTG
jgi:hypothetical protein